MSDDHMQPILDALAGHVEAAHRAKGTAREVLDALSVLQRIVTLLAGQKAEAQDSESGVEQVHRLMNERDDARKERDDAREELAEAKARLATATVGVLPMTYPRDGSVLYVDSISRLEGTERMPHKIRLRRTGDMGVGHCADYERVTAREEKPLAAADADTILVAREVLPDLAEALSMLRRLEHNVRGEFKAAFIARYDALLARHPQD